MLVALLGLAGESLAGKRPLGFLVGAGGSGTIGDLAIHAEFGFHATAGVRFTPAPSLRNDIDLLLVGGYYGFPENDPTKREFTMLTVGIQGRINNVLHSSANIYASTGAGLARTTLAAYNATIRFGAAVTETQPVSERTESNPYVSAGFGLQVGNPEKLQFFIEARMTNVFGTQIKNLTWFPVTIGLLY